MLPRQPSGLALSAFQWAGPKLLPHYRNICRRISINPDLLAFGFQHGDIDLFTRVDNSMMSFSPGRQVSVEYVFIFFSHYRLRITIELNRAEF